MNLNQHITVAEQQPRTQQQASMVQDNVQKTQFALEMIRRMPQQPPKPVDPPRIPSLGALAIPN